MGEDFSTSDCSWKKMVIAKANDEWISTIKSEQIGAHTTSMNTSDFSMEAIQMPFGGVKEEPNAERSYQEYGDDGSSTGPDDPLMIEEAGAAGRRRRKSSGARCETDEERAARLTKMSAYAAHRLANESAEQRALRLKRMSEYAARRLAHESAEQRARRLQRMSAYAARRLANETPEQRRTRLARMSAYAARRHALKKIASSAAISLSPTEKNFNPQMNNDTDNQS